MGFLEERKKKKRYKKQVCPECGNSMNEITRDYDYIDDIREVNIGGKVVGREKKMIRPHFYGILKGYKCSKNHKWADHFKVDKVVIDCPNDKCDGKLKKLLPDDITYLDTYLGCEYNGKGCYVSKIKAPQKLMGRHFKYFIENMNEDMKDKFYGWDFTYFSPHEKSFRWYTKVKTTKEVESPAKDLERTAEKQIEDIEDDLF